MSTLTRYIARVYTINVATLFVLLFGLVITVDVILNLRRFTRTAEDVIDSGGGDVNFFSKTATTLVLVVDLWGPRLLQLFAYLSGVVLIAAMGFTCAQLVRHREFVAMMAGGLSLHRVIRPFLIVALAVTTLQIINQEILIPRIAHLLAREPGDSGKRHIDSFRVRLVPDGAGRLLSARRFDPPTATLDKPFFWERDAANRLLGTVSADRAQWDGRGWVLENGVAQVPTPGSAMRAQPIDRLDIPLDPDAIVIHHLKDLGQNLSWRQISRMIESGGLDERSRTRLETVRWGRIAGLASNLITLLAALPLFLVRMPQPMLVPTLKSAPIALLGLAAAALSTSAALPGIPVWLGVFVPSLILLPIAIALLSGIRT